MAIIEGEPTEGRIINIRWMGNTGSDTADYGISNQIAVVSMQRGLIREGWYPLERDHAFSIGDNIIITSITHSDEQSGGSITRYELTPDLK